MAGFLWVCLVCTLALAMAGAVAGSREWSLWGRWL